MSTSTSMILILLLIYGFHYNTEASWLCFASIVNEVEHTLQLFIWTLHTGYLHNNGAFDGYMLPLIITAIWIDWYSLPVWSLVYKDVIYRIVMHSWYLTIATFAFINVHENKTLGFYFLIFIVIHIIHYGTE